MGHLPHRRSQPKNEEYVSTAARGVTTHLAIAMYQWYQIMICLLKFDFFFFTGVTMQVWLINSIQPGINAHIHISQQLLIIVLSTNSAEFGITIAAIPVVLTLLALCGVAVKREIKW